MGTNRRFRVITAFILICAIIVTCAAYTGPVKVKAATDKGIWVLTGEDYFAYENGAVKYVSKQNDHYQYICKYLGKTDDGFVKFLASGGFYASNETATSDSYHMCSVPESSYAAGGLVTLTLKNYEENVTSWCHGAGSNIAIRYEDKNADGKEKDTFVYNDMGYTKFESADANDIGSYPGMNKSGKVKVNMPSSAEYGDRIAIVFKALTAYDSWSGAPQASYGGTMWYTWIYTYTEPETSDDGLIIGDAEDDIVVSQVKKLKLTNKSIRHLYISFGSIKNASGYQIRYATNKSMKNAKTLNTTATKGYFCESDGSKSSFKKGSRYYVQVRAYIKDSAGNKIYGKWSAKKSLKIKR